jgi:hypothetical protein
MARDAGLSQGPREAAVRQVVGIEWLPLLTTEDQRTMRALDEALERDRLGKAKWAWDFPDGYVSFAVARTLR